MLPEPGQASTTVSLIALPVNALAIWIGFKKGGWWHILTVLGAGGALFNIVNLAAKVSK
jgi:hypothetical protein